MARPLLKREVPRSAAAGRSRPETLTAGAVVRGFAWFSSACGLPPPSDQDLAELWRDCDRGDFVAFGREMFSSEDDEHVACLPSEPVDTAISLPSSSSRR